MKQVRQFFLEVESPTLNDRKFVSFFPNIYHESVMT